MTLQFASSVLNCLETSPVAMQVPAAPLANRRREILTFFTLAVFIWAFIAVGVVATWGLGLDLSRADGPARVRIKDTNRALTLA